MITQEYLVGDLELRLSKSKPSQELEVTYEQMAYWIDIARDRVTRDYIRANRTIDDSLVMVVDGLTPYEASEQFFLELGVMPLDVKNGRSLVFVRDSEGNYYGRESQANKSFISKLRFARPSSCNVVYSLNGSSIHLNGDDFVRDVTYEVGVVVAEVTREKDKDERYYAAPSTIHEILEIAEDIGLRELTGRGIYDVNNDGLGNNI